MAVCNNAIIARSVLLIRGGANPRTNTAQHSLKFPRCHVARQSAKGGNLPSHDAEAISQTFPTSVVTIHLVLPPSLNFVLHLLTFVLHLLDATMHQPN